MGESTVSIEVASEAALAELAGRVAGSWLEQGREACISVGLCGELGAGKTAWVRAMLRALGLQGAVPSPTYTLMEIYEISLITLIHMDFYRIDGDEELEQLGLRDWLGTPGCWILAEWPERAPRFVAQCDVVIRFAVTGDVSRQVSCTATRAAARRWLAPFELT